MLGGTGIAGALCGELAFTFRVGLGEMELEADENPRGIVEVAPLFARGGEDAGFFENWEEETKDGVVGDGFVGATG
jgi:hypothetical protein